MRVRNNCVLYNLKQLITKLSENRMPLSFTHRLERERDMDLVKELYQKLEKAKSPRNELKYQNASEWFLDKWGTLWLFLVKEEGLNK